MLVQYNGAVGLGKIGFPITCGVSDIVSILPSGNPFAAVVQNYGVSPGIGGCEYNYYPIMKLGL